MINTLKLHKDSGVDECIENSPINRIAKPLKQKKAEHDLSDLNLDKLIELVKNFEGCELKKAAINTVFGDGNPHADIMFVGEAPGASEDKEGIPFCGQSGKLLNNIIKALGYTRENVYITNTVFWRPPGNRRPTPSEIEICKPFVEKHIALIKPKLIILVGSTAVESLLDNKGAMHEVREGFYDYKNEFLNESIKTVVIFHPSYLLRQQTKKKLMWYDVLRIKEYLNKK